ncbi:efflux RND transporter periplasmic adaptor subunit [Lysobacter auxotrophicus]|uniref:Efflux RND transporter periplasmic adaptor subunit n=1 Tax=Lysobacter auxotrophicus TaxID=2992573 RepID=A0ABN6UH60_9GAMM|nr:efflux RND transporter periplasmic adaptor subunit [Lysobacter auxotrophicus]BDU15653.1 efflux RND transporter periplasmic adaptor subunit [Lysobacter auxotrophicus]
MSAARPSSRNARKPTPWIRHGIVAAVAIALIAGGVYFYRKRGADAAEGAFRTVQVERGDIRVAISSTGTLSAISTVTVGSQISGQVTDVLVDFNDPVTRGQVIARIDPKTYEAQIAQGNAQIASARASLSQAQATLLNAQLDYQRKSDLGARQLVARSDVDLAKAALDQARAQVNAAQASIRQQTASTQTTQVNLERTVIRSPVDGVVLTRSIEPGQTVAASLQAPELFTIAEDLAKMKIELAVDEADIGQVRTGQNVSFTVDAFPDRQFRGTVEQVRLSATTTNNVVTYPVVVTVDNSDGTLLPGLTVNAEIEVSKREDVLKISNAALRYKPADDAQSATAGASPGAGGPRGGTGMLDDLARTAASMKLNANQQAAFDTAAEAIRARQAARQQQATQSGGGNRLFGGGGGGGRGPVMVGGAGAGNLQAQMRQRMTDRFKEDFAAFRATLDDAQKKQWDAAIANLVNAKRVQVYKLVDGKPQPVMVRLGASDGTDTEISGGGLQAGDAIVTGERAARE